MDETPVLSNELLKQVVDAFWEGFPPYWHRVRAHIRQVALAQFDITVEQFHILRHIRKGKASISELAEAKNISRPATSQAVDVLVNKGLVIRAQVPQDRRHVHLSLTASGSSLLDAIFENTRQWMMHSLAPLSETELLALLQALEALKKV